MTMTVKRGTGRAAATARSKKAAQTTPLPEKAANNLDSLSLGELRQLAVAQGWSTVTKGTKASIIKTLRDNPDGPPAVAKANHETKAESHPERRADSGPGKAQRLVEALRPAGWKVTTKTERDGTSDYVTATAKRGKEVLVMVFANGGFSYGASSYVNDGATRKVRNVSEAIRLWGQT